MPAKAAAKVWAAGALPSRQLKRNVQANRQLDQIVELAGIRRPVGQEQARELQSCKVSAEGLFSRAQQFPEPMQGWSADQAGNQPCQR